ncbi:uncharacterized protein LACBIDRAFT_335619 [Laccaria bicolor S238N-H82]|uniref:Predicted protein n=1 Tax=Laccaria bicolor (strain S238N-H82 / ATCC MYA-4686) TaxID=486041 RepID=B0E2V4_LACBS|nr:uncharacterized protein LACBIDRAFT_335619 [Laccaria bicolor S238N-H82]EDQ98826.1 predicted protein [Laccaria bicolor S238N-H82]|eukprot:XP_001890524.1 predicted protein [Laccaria bicolor S238N-H82]
MPEKKTASKKKPISQAPPMVTPPAPASASASKPAAASSPPPPVLEESLAKLITLTTSLPDLPLGLIWVHAFREGSRDGFRRGTELFKDKDVKQAFRDGGDEGLPEGHTCTANKLDAMVQVDSVEARPPSVDAAIQVSPSHHTSSSQTTLPLLVNAEAQAQLMDLPPAATTAPTLDPPALDWSDATSIPIVPIFPKNQPHHDLSALCTTNPNPFSSLAHRNRCSRLPLGKCDISGPRPPFQPRRTPPVFPVFQTVPHQHFIPVLNLTALPLPSTPLKIPMALDWESDPHLSDLSQALKALGWIHR